MRPHRWILSLASRLVPKTLRAEWRAEWDAELHHREAATEPWTGRARPHRCDLARDAVGAVFDALWLQSSRWYALRLFGRHWRLATTAIVSLAIAIAATVMGLSAYDALLIRSPGVTDPARLRFIHIRTPENLFDAASFPEYGTYRAQTRAFVDITAFPYVVSSLSFTGGGQTRQIVATSVADNFFTVLGVVPRRGMLTFRTSPARDVFDIAISEKLWWALGSNPGIVGTTVEVNEHPVTIVGVVPQTFTGMTWGFAPDVWMSLVTAQNVFGTPATELTDRSRRTFHMVGRLRPGVTDAQATIDVQQTAAGIARDYPAVSRGHSAGTTALSVTPPGDRPWTALILGALVVIVLLTLVVACANVTNLLLGLTQARRLEMLIRAALGATRLQLVVPLVREALVLCVVAGGLGYCVAWRLLAKLATLQPSLGTFLPTLSLDLRPDTLVLVATMAIAVMAGVAVGLPPALRAASDGLSGDINRAVASGHPQRSRLRNVLMVIQMTIATVVLVGVSISLQSLFNLRHVSLGFTARGLVYGGIDVHRSGYDRRTAPAFLERVRARVRAMPDVTAVTLASDPPLMGYSLDHLTVDSAPPPADGHGAEMPYVVVDDAYFSVLGIPVSQGRTFDSRDRPGRPDVAVVNQTFVRRHFPDRDPIGRRFRLESDNHLVEIIGVVADGKYGEIDEGELPFVYLSLAQRDPPVVTVVARLDGPRDAIARELFEMDPHIALGGVGAMTLDDALGISLAVPLTIVWMTIGFGAIAVALSVFGLYSTVFYAVSQRHLEMGIRTALGATPADLFAMVLGQTGRVAGVGTVLGFAAALALTPVAASVFYGIAPVEPKALAAALALVLAITLATTYAVVRPWTRLAALDLLLRR